VYILTDTATHNGQHFDLRVVAEDICFDGIDTLQTTDGRPSIAQDVVHAIIESQLLKKLIAQRDFMTRRSIYVQIETLVENDQRIVPGTAQVSESTTETTIWVQAKTYDYQDIAFHL